MKNKEILDLMLDSTNISPYSGKLSKKNNIISAIALAHLCKGFADTGQTNEAMEIPSHQWIEIIEDLELMLLNRKKKLNRILNEK